MKKGRKSKLKLKEPFGIFPLMNFLLQLLPREDDTIKG